MYNGVLSISDIDYLIRSITFAEDSKVCHKLFGVGVILHKNKELTIQCNIPANNYWWVCFDNPMDGKRIRSIRADQLKNISSDYEAKTYDWNNHVDSLVEDYRRSI